MKKIGESVVLICFYFQTLKFFYSSEHVDVGDKCCAGLVVGFAATPSVQENTAALFCHHT